MITWRSKASKSPIGFYNTNVESGLENNITQFKWTCYVFHLKFGNSLYFKLKFLIKSLSLEISCLNIEIILKIMCILLPLNFNSKHSFLV